MNKNKYRLVFSRLRNMLIAVEETATATGKEAGQTSVRNKESQGLIFTLRQIVFSALALLGALPSWSSAQIISGGANAPSVIQTQNGLDQVNINRPSGAGVSMNTYNRFDVQPKGAILNNSPAIVQTQQAGLINGNPNFGPGQSARVIVNQVNSSAASQINGRVEVAGRRAEVVIANGSGISVNGGGFINTSRAILTTGTPNFAADGSLSGLNVTGGNISIQGAGLNAGDTDQVDLLARAVQANAAIYAKNLNVVTGANSIDYGTLNATSIAGTGAAPGVSIDVSNLGGMYANRIVLVGTENGVGVSNKGVLAAQAGDLTLTTQGKPNTRPRHAHRYRNRFSPDATTTCNPISPDTLLSLQDFSPTRFCPWGASLPEVHVRPSHKHRTPKQRNPARFDGARSATANRAEQGACKPPRHIRVRAAHLASTEPVKAASAPAGLGLDGHKVLDARPCGARRVLGLHRM